MQNSLLVGLSRQVALRREIDVIANNMANINTNGFKAEGIILNDFTKSPARAEAFKAQDRRVHFVIDRGTYHNFAKGSIEQTGNPFDVALQDANTFFVIQTPEGERYTRAGNFVLNNEGKLVTQNNQPVQGEGGEFNFTAEETQFSIARDGTVSTDQGTKGKLRTVTFNNPQALEKIGDNLFGAKDQQPIPAEGPQMIQGYLEQSNVSAIKEMSRMIEVTRSYASLTSMMDKMNEQQKTSIERIGNLKL